IAIIEMVITGDDAARLILGNQVFVSDAGLIVEERNRVECLLAFEREITAHDLEGNVAASVGRVVVAAADPEQGADDVAFLTLVEVVEPASQLEREEEDSSVLRFGASEQATGAGKLADGMHVAGDEDGTDGANVRRFLADVEVILISEPVLAGGVHAARNGRSAAGEEHHDVFAEIREVALVAGAEALAEADQQEERADSPGNAEHGEERTQLVRPEGAENLRENVEHHLHGVITREHRGGFWLFALSNLGPH